LPKHPLWLDDLGIGFGIGCRLDVVRMLYLALCWWRFYLLLLDPFLLRMELFDKLFLHIDTHLGIIKELLEVLTPFMIAISGIEMLMMQLVLDQFL